MLILSAPALHAEAPQGQRVITGERYVPGIWVDPDGCEHWVMDDGAEGYMSPHLTRDGKPICRNQPRATNEQISPTDPVTGARKGERYIPGIWVDPDGCEHWVMDDGAEGFMSPHVTRNGMPVCRKMTLCAVLPSDPMFAPGSVQVSAQAQDSLVAFFRSQPVRSFSIVGHTDNREGDGSSMRLSLDRAQAVARVAQAAGAHVIDVRGYGARKPAASNATPEGMAKNRRVEIVCVR